MRALGAAVTGDLALAVASFAQVEHRLLVNPQARLLRHFVAALAYRVQKAIRDAPPEFASFRAAPGSRTPHELVRHMSGVLHFALGRLTAPRALLETLPDFDAEVRRFHAILEAIASRLAEDSDLPMDVAERLLQGPLSDAMTHAGQLAMLRRLAGNPVPPENFFEAAVSAENVGCQQPLPVSPDEDWPEAPADWKAPKRSLGATEEEPEPDPSSDRSVRERAGHGERRRSS